MHVKPVTYVLIYKRTHLNEQGSSHSNVLVFGVDRIEVYVYICGLVGNM